MIFDLEQPNSEDQQLRDYLTEHELVSRYPILRIRMSARVK